MSKQQKYFGGVVGLAVVALLVVGVLVTTAQGKSNQQIGVVNMQAVFTQYLAQPLYEARDKLQSNFNEQAEDLSDEEKNELFIALQTELEALELSYGDQIANAIDLVAKELGLEVVVESTAVLHGGLDITEQLLVKLQS